MSLNPFSTPITLKGWQGNPPIKTSCFGISRVKVIYVLEYDGMVIVMFISFYSIFIIVIGKNDFEMDGTAVGRINCTLANWTELDKYKEREDLKQSGVYFLFGISDDIGENIVYIGQAGARKNGEGILYRLQEYKRDEKKNYWTEAVGFTTLNNSLNNSFGPTEISYLEHRFFNLVKNAKRHNGKNNVDPTSGHVTEEKESEPIENNED